MQLIGLFLDGYVFVKSVSNTIFAELRHSLKPNTCNSIKCKLIFLVK
jgi:hypothetical protein